MKVHQCKIKLFGKIGVLFQVIDANGAVVQVCNTKEEADQYINAN